MREITFVSSCVTVGALLFASVVAADAPLTPSQLEGRRLFGQSCAVCHTRPLIVMGTYGPVLSKETLGGQAEAMRVFISAGTQRMPGFRFHFSPEQIDAIVGYLKTVSPPAPDSNPAPTHGAAMKEDM